MAKKMGEDDPQLRSDLEKAKTNFEAMLAAAQAELETYWQQWDTATDAANQPALDAAKARMVALLNRRSYLRNLVRNVNDALA
jgi:molecular chaperone HscB